jgi:hypothetical protein
MSKKGIVVRLLRTSSLILWTCCIGCGDPVRTTSQSVRLRVTASGSGASIAGADVSLKDDFDAEPTTDVPKNQSKVVWRAHLRENWEQLPWFTGCTDKEGYADIVVTYTIRDRPGWRDLISGKRFLVRISDGTGRDDEVSVLMNPGELGEASRHTVTIGAIGEPEYVAK